MGGVIWNGRSNGGGVQRRVGTSIRSTSACFRSSTCCLAFREERRTASVGPGGDQVLQGPRSLKHFADEAILHWSHRPHGAWSRHRAIHQGFRRTPCPPWRRDGANVGIRPGGEWSHISGVCAVLNRPHPERRSQAIRAGRRDLGRAAAEGGAGPMNKT